jgi:uncharacterized protein (DUF952 family)
MSVILHIARKIDWEDGVKCGAYSPSTLRTHGFIHCSTPAQVIPVADFLFKGQPGLVLLCIETGRVTAEIRWENLEGGTKLFPHVYGPLPVSSVVSVCDFPPKDDGTFELPEAVARLTSSQ